MKKSYIIKAIASLLVTMTATTVIAAGPGRTLKGRVVDAQGDPIVGAVVNLGEGLKMTLTDDQGRFELKKVDATDEVFVDFVGYPKKAAVPYVVAANPELVDRIAKDDMMRGCTIAANGFYGPQGRVLRVDLAVPDINEKITAFRYEGQRITNYEMEGSCIAGLALHMGHHAMTVCCVIAQRKIEAANTDYKPRIKELVKTVLERI